MDYNPPPGPPPSHRHPQQDEYAPPPGPPPGHDNDAAAAGPAHDWAAAVPDTSLFPPPPPFFSGWDRSPANNATGQQAAEGEAWCRQHPLVAPQPLPAAALQALARHAVAPVAPARGFVGEVRVLDAGGGWGGRTTAAHAPDATVLGYPPLYSVVAHSPLATGRAHTAYFEVRVLANSDQQQQQQQQQSHHSHNPFHRTRPNEDDSEVSLAIGFAALPYPPFRLPGWHRGSLAVHGDDGHRYVNDRWGGRSFTKPMRRGETYGIGMTVRPGDGDAKGTGTGKGSSGKGSSSGSGGPLEVDVFFTCQGREVGRWDLHEETDASVNMPVTGLEGFHDLSAAVGSFDNVRYEVVFDPAQWLFKGVVE